MKKIGEGAEAKIYLTSIFGNIVLVKVRFRKKYRERALDESLRRSRTKQEAHAMIIARRAGVRVPVVVAFDKFSIYMQRLEGRLLREVLSDTNANLPYAVFVELGHELAKMHNANIAHGDFTPANIILNGNSHAFIIDFGLSEITSSIEAKALDLLLMKRSITSEQYSAFLQGYAAYSKSKEVLARLNEIEKRGRYQTRTLITS